MLTIFKFGRKPKTKQNEYTGGRDEFYRRRRPRLSRSEFDKTIVFIDLFLIFGTFLVFTYVFF